MKFNIYFTIAGPAGSTEAPNKYNPVGAASWEDCLTQLAEMFPGEMTQFNVRVVGVRIEECREQKPPPPDTDRITSKSGSKAND